MFKQLPSRVCKDLKENGSFRLRIVKGVTDTSMLYSIVPIIRSEAVYQVIGSQGGPTPIFELNVANMDSLMVYTALETSPLSPVDEATTHFFLGWFVSNAEVWAKNAGKSKVVVESGLPHLVEWFVEHRWSVLKPSLAAKNSFRGVKDLLKTLEAR